MTLPTVQSFCFCVSLKTATTFLGILNSFIDKGTSCLIHHAHTWTIKDESFTILIFLYVVMAIAFVTTLLMIIGSAKGKHKLMMPFLAFGIMDFHVTTLSIWYGTFKLFGDSIVSGIMALILGNLAVGFAAFFYLIVYSRYSEICDESDDQKALINIPEE